MIRARFVIPLLLTVVALGAGAVMLFQGQLQPLQVLPLGLAAACVAWIAASVPSLVSRQVDRILGYARADRSGSTDDLGDLRDRADELGSLADAVVRQVDRTQELEAANTSLAAALATTITDATRRSLVLVHRLLARLDELQKVEEDPQRLAQLYELDHLSVRLRRQAENMLVVADDAPLGDADEPPMRLVDVVRMASSETEEYRRVEVSVPSLASVAGWAARPLGQLLAALLDNALRYSPPTAPVTVSSIAAPDSTALLVRDRGLGMDDSAIDAANALLVSPPPLHAVQSRQLGLYVVSVLAARLGITVHLVRPADDDSGLEARIVVPAALLQTAVEDRVTRVDVASNGVRDLFTSPSSDPRVQTPHVVPAFEPTPEVPIPSLEPVPVQQVALPSEPPTPFDPFADVIADHVMVAGTARQTPPATPTGHAEEAEPQTEQAPEHAPPQPPEQAPEQPAGLEQTDERGRRHLWLFGRRAETQGWSTTLPGHRTNEVEHVTQERSEGEVSFVAAPDDPRRQAPEPEAAGPSRSFVAAPPPEQPKPAPTSPARPRAEPRVPDDHVPSVVDNPLLEIFHTELRSVSMPADVDNPAIELSASLPAVLDGIVVNGVAPDADLQLPARPAGGGTPDHDEPIARLFAGRQSVDDDAIDALAGLVRAEGEA